MADMRAQHLFHHGLGYLLAAFGEPVVALAGQPERVGEIGDARPGQRLAEGDALRPGHRQRRGGAQHLRHTPAAQVLHGPHAGGLGPRPAVGDRDPGLDDHAADAVQAQFGGGRQASWAAAGDQHGGALGARIGPSWIAVVAAAELDAADRPAGAAASFHDPVSWMSNRAAFPGAQDLLLADLPGPEDAGCVVRLPPRGHCFAVNSADSPAPADQRGPAGNQKEIRAECIRGRPARIELPHGWMA